MRHTEVIFITFLCLGSLTGCSGITPLHEAAQQGDTKQALALIDLGTNVNANTIASETPLHWAAAGGHVETVRALLDRGATIDVRNVNGTTPLHYAASAGRMDIVQLLVERGADVTAKEKSSVFATPESAAQQAERQGHPDVAQYLREAEARTAQGKTPPESATSAPSPARPAKPTDSPPPPIY